MPSPVKRKHEEDEGTKRKRKTQKKIWTKDDQLAIFLGILDYENETKVSHSEDWDAFYDFIKGSLESDFSKVQLKDKVRGLKKKYTSGGKKHFSLDDDDDTEMFKLATIIWPNENVDAPCVVEDELVTEPMDLAEEDVNEEINQAKDAEIDDGAKEKKREEEDDGVDEFCLLQDAFEAVLFPRMGKYQQNLLLHNLRKVKPEKRRKLSDEWKALLVEEHRLLIKKLTFATKLAIALE